MIDWKQKLSSRKLWAGIAAAIMSVLVAIFGENIDVQYIEIIKTGIYALIAYIFGESAIDLTKYIANAFKPLYNDSENSTNVEENGDDNK